MLQIDLVGCFSTPLGYQHCHLHEVLCCALLQAIRPLSSRAGQVFPPRGGSLLSQVVLLTLPYNIVIYMRAGWNEVLLIKHSEENIDKK
jgi:hypothetical protein